MMCSLLKNTNGKNIHKTNMNAHGHSIKRQEHWDMPMTLIINSEKYSNTESQFVLVKVPEWMISGA